VTLQKRERLAQKIALAAVTHGQSALPSFLEAKHVMKFCAELIEVDEVAHDLWSGDSIRFSTCCQVLFVKAFALWVI
jgi:hypothetical protein